MKFNRPYVSRQCEWIVKPGEYVIDLWDGERCIITSHAELVRCEHCNKDYCLVGHYHKHMIEIAEEMEGTK